MHYGFGTVNAPVGTIDTNPVATRLRVDTVKIGVNYRWGADRRDILIRIFQAKA
jgi:hypothetical protein